MWKTCVFAPTLRVDWKLPVTMAVREHTRGVELPQGALPALLRRARENLVVVGEAQQAHYLGKRQVDAATVHQCESYKTIRSTTAYLRLRDAIHSPNAQCSSPLAHTRAHTHTHRRENGGAFSFVTRVTLRGRIYPRGDTDEIYSAPQPDRPRNESHISYLVRRFFPSEFHTIIRSFLVRSVRAARICD